MTTLANVTTVELASAFDSYEDAIDNGQIMVRSAFYNASKGKLTLVLQEGIARDITNDTPLAILLTHEVSAVRKVTATLPAVDSAFLKMGFSAEFIQHLKSVANTPDNIVDMRQYNISALSVMKSLSPKVDTFNIEVTENHEQNPDYPQDPKEDGQGNVLKKDGLPIYVHTRILINEEPKHTFIQNDKVDTSLPISNTAGDLDSFQI